MFQVEFHDIIPPPQIAPGKTLRAQTKIVPIVWFPWHIFATKPAADKAAENLTRTTGKPTRVVEL